MATLRPQDFANLNRKQTCILFFCLVEYSTAWIAVSLGPDLLSHFSSASSGFRFLGITITVIGVALIIACYGTCALAQHQKVALGKSICWTLPLLVTLAGLGIFALAVSSKGGGKSIPGRSYEEFHLESYSNWMVKRVNDTHNWDRYYKKAIVKHHVCKKFFKEYRLDTVDKFHKRSLDPFESGCCKPPEVCNFNYTSPPTWVKPNDVNYSNIDCIRWGNDPNILCFNCKSCKAAFLEDLKGHWFLAGLTFVVLAGKQLCVGTCALVSVIMSGDNI